MHPMAHAFNGGLNYVGVKNGTVAAPKVEAPIVKADPADKKYMSVYFDVRGVELAWIRKDTKSRRTRRIKWQSAHARLRSRSRSATRRAAGRS